MVQFGSLARNAAWNVTGNVAPLLVAALATPYLIGVLGIERFGLLSLVWALVGYFSLFDLGLGRAITQLTARHQGSTEDVSGICSSGMVMIAIIGVAGGCITAIANYMGLPGILGISKELQPEFSGALWAVAVGVPIAACTAGARGILEGFHAFRLLNLIRVPSGMLLFLIPCIVASFSPRLDHVTWLLIATRVVILAVHLLASTTFVQLAVSRVRAPWPVYLVRFGGWLTVSNVTGPILTYCDRILVSAATSAVALAYYAPPLEAVSRLLVLPLALTAALLPAMSRTVGRSAEAAQLRTQAMRLTLTGAGILVLGGVLCAEIALDAWLGPEFARQGTLPTRILLVGLFFQSIAQIPMTALYSRGRPRDIALFNLLQLPVYPPALYVATASFGLAGAAVMWSGRNLVECIVLLALEQRQRRNDKAGATAHA